MFSPFTYRLREGRLAEGLFPLSVVQLLGVGSNIHAEFKASSSLF